ncbi:LCP family protein [Candidatus Haliotispira prima]|uniref:LCP family protein n=1 Tax=Candidatus Haliotispira prima TaxID=3034016 RepID=A0ABY8MJJ8_9SPIO|nr:LCP family protein [Candidatus Haliotispira prima]
MNYRVFRWLVTGSVVSLLAVLVLFFVLLFTDGLGSSNARGRGINSQLKQIAENQGKLISGSREMGKLLNLPQEQYSQVVTPISSESLQNMGNEVSDGLPGTDGYAGRDVTEPLEKDGSPLEIAFYDALRYLDRNLEQERAWRQLNRLLESEAWEDLLKEQRLRLERSEGSVRLFPDNDKLIPLGQAAPGWFEVSTAIPSSRSGSGSESASDSSDAEARLKLTTSFSDTGSDTGFDSDMKFSVGLSEFVREQTKKLYGLAVEYNKMYRFLTGRKVAEKLEAKDLYIKSLQPAKVEKVSASIKRTLSVAQTDWEIRTRDEQVVARLHFDIGKYRLLWNDKSYRSLQLLRSDWDIFVGNVDTRTAGQRKEDEMRGYLVQMLADSAFLLQMRQYGLWPAPLPPREDDYYEYYDLLNIKSEKMASFALQKRVGEAYLMDRDDVKIRGLKSFLLGAEGLQNLFDDQPSEGDSGEAGEKSGPKIASNSSFYPDRPGRNGAFSGFSGKSGDPGRGKGWDGGGPDSQEHDIEVILLVGTHDNIADVIMLISVNKKTKTLTVISVPRDLYYRDVKVNAVYSMYGPELFMDALTDITGITISKYISVDMYAFVEMVGLIGGIDVYLKEDLIDPTYKVKQMGKWETLVMRKGQHHLDGLGALRYARSRHTSNDFERSERQQLILNQVAEKLSRQLSSPKKLWSFLQVVQKYMKTNFSTANIVRYWLEYSDYQRNFSNTISTDNVLYYTFTNYLGLDAEQLAEAQQDESFFRGSFILLPKNNDWSLIRKYIMYLQN